MSEALATVYPPLTTASAPNAARPSRHAAGGTTANSGDETMAGKSAPGRSSSTSTSLPFARSPTLAGSVSRRREVVARALDVDDQGGQRRRRVRVDDPEPAAHDVVRGQRRPVGERQVRAKVEDDAPAIGRDVPARGERRLEDPRRVVDRERLVQLGGDGSGAHVARGSRVERLGGRGEDPDLAVVERVDAARAAREQDREDDAERADQGPDAPHARSMREGRGT